MGPSIVWSQDSEIQSLDRALIDYSMSEEGLISTVEILFFWIINTSTIDISIS